MASAADPPSDGLTEPLLDAVDISYAYLGKYPALENVTFTIRRGERVALLGPNGGGKSTLLKILDGLVFADSGTIKAFGHDLTEDILEDDQFNEAFRSRIGFVFQNTDAQVFSSTVRDEVAFGPLNMGLDTDEAAQRVDDLLKLLDIETLADRAPYQLSGGQKKRVAIASVLVMNPEVLLFDEPTAALDPSTQDWLLDLIVELNLDGKTMVVATHDLSTIETLAGRCLVLDEDHHLSYDGDLAGLPADHLAHRHAY
jgi:cobalt/nickel transport system ATP-binding protein